MNGPEVHIRSVGTALPGPPVDNAALTHRFHMSPVWEQWIDTFIGTRTRHFSLDLETGELRYTLTDLGEAASRRALTNAGLAAGEVDLMVMGTSTPDRLMPATINMIAERLGIDGVPTYQLQSGCSGAVQALDVAHQMLRSGRYRTALVLGADSCAKHTDLNVNPNDLPTAEQVNGVLFGDGAGALVLSTEPAPGSVVVRHVFHRLVGLNRAPGQIVEWFGRGDRDSGRQPLSEDYKAIEESVPKMAVHILNELLDELDWSEGDIDYLLPPQLSGRMTAHIAEILDLPGAREITCVVETGNTGNALPFFQLEAALPQLTEGDRALGIAVESSKWIKAGFALEKS
ncbi:3-oxoacyl-ACP synthase [Streptomyces armeniacus]|uniref:3-oxoacyl-ACP synthase n=1 Tax=Streptomyces armeniacus TaxID=83291 RepID=A0A345XLB1_9ACTN|nr:3-oxoacyl-ACP synthase III family protein [Streptomyces armeniacus]AXK32427.1 3-oxoacyl-ACP synthase [Streptomyces armeniacus]